MDPDVDAPGRRGEAVAVQPRVGDVHGLPARGRGGGRRQGVEPGVEPCGDPVGDHDDGGPAEQRRGGVTTDSGSPATPYDHGAGQVNPAAALDAGLVYELGEEDYLQFLCDYGYDASQIKLVAASLPGGFSCGAGGNASDSKDLISGLNYPSIAVTGLGKAGGTRTVSRVVTNVGAQQEATYTVAVAAPAGLDVKVVPGKLEFTKSVKKLGFQVSFSGKNAAAAAKGDLFGSITWSDGKHTVRSPFVVTI
ncbi:hypothetical protein OsJ_29790 [Oryza sativa Japonica Group]|uniref:Subtilisin-like protease fibronectin type-III domain-containing protein n=1 Tax=Oryza sativa subsp. japonica TaxID=39947 RepID=A3C013_ORYSJ|nr:hypothetical protein OsJ_29790 [Oryza sativa Japonica Group]